jgi:pyruvate ferredoxin oxidoreductase alpha subunit
MSFGGFGGAIYHEIRHVLYDEQMHPLIVNYIYGLGGRDYSPKVFRSIFDELMRIARSGRIEKQISYFGVRD